MASYLNSDSLIESVKRRASIPTSQITFQDVDFLEFANEEMSMGMLPSMLQYHEEFFVYTYETPIVQDQTQYALPQRSIGNKLRAIFFKDNSGNLQDMTRINPDDLTSYQYSANTGRFVQYYIENDYIVLVPNVNSLATGSIVMKYYLRPNRLVETDQVAIISAINTLTGEVTVSALPTAFASTSRYDFVQISGNHKNLAMDLTPSSIDTVNSILTFAPASVPVTLAVGDHLALAGECLIPQIPDDLHVILAQRVAARCLEAQNDQAGLQAANLKLAELESKIPNLIDNRIESDPPKITNFRSPLRYARSRFNRRI